MVFNKYKPTAQHILLQETANDHTTHTKSKGHTVLNINAAARQTNSIQTII